MQAVRAGLITVRAPQKTVHVFQKAIEDNSLHKDFELYLIRIIATFYFNHFSMRSQTLIIEQFIRRKEKQERKARILLVSESLIWFAIACLVASRFMEVSPTQNSQSPEPRADFAFTFLHPAKETVPKTGGLDSLRQALSHLIIDKPEDQDPFEFASMGMDKVLTQDVKEKNDKPRKVQRTVNRKPASKVNSEDSPTTQQKSESTQHSLFGSSLPSFPGGFAAMQKFISSRLDYPVSALENEIEGKVLLRLWVEDDGSVTDVSVIEGIGFGCDEEAIRLGKEMPAWNPGERKGRKAAMAAYIPIVFSRTN